MNMATRRSAPKPAMNDDRTVKSKNPGDQDQLGETEPTTDSALSKDPLFEIGRRDAILNEFLRQLNRWRGWDATTSAQNRRKELEESQVVENLGSFYETYLTELELLQFAFGPPLSSKCIARGLQNPVPGAPKLGPDADFLRMFTASTRQGPVSFEVLLRDLTQGKSKLPHAVIRRVFGCRLLCNGCVEPAIHAVETILRKNMQSLVPRWADLGVLHREIVLYFDSLDGIARETPIKGEAIAARMNENWRVANSRSSEDVDRYSYGRLFKTALSDLVDGNILTKPSERGGYLLLHHPRGFVDRAKDA
jgi:hypothetical protein